MRLCLFTLLLIAAPARGGQLFIEEYGLPEVARAGSTVVVGTVISTGKPTRVDLEVERVFSTGTPKVKVGDKLSLKQYPGVVWTNPHKSPIDRRLRGHLGQVQPGARIVAVPHDGGTLDTVEILAASPEVLRKLGVLFEADGAAQYAKEPDASLVADLGDRDLAELARVELARRGKLSVAVLLKGDARFVDAHYRKLAPAARIAFGREALALVEKQPALRDAVAALVLRQPEPSLIEPIARLLARYDRKQSDDARRLDDFRVELLMLAEQHKTVPPANVLDLSPLADYFLDDQLHRPDYRSSDDSIAKLTAFLNPAAKTKLIVGFVDGLFSSSHARKDSLDLFLLAEAERLAEEAPSPVLLVPLAKLDPTRLRVGSDKQFMMNAMLRIGIAIVRAAPATRQKVRDLVEPWLEQNVPASDDARDAWIKNVGATHPAPAKAASLQLMPGQRLRLSSGERVGFKREGKDYALSIDKADGGQTWTFVDKDDDWYREFWVEPYLIVIRRIGTQIGLRLTPLDKEPVHLEDPEALQIAKKLQDRRGCPEYVSHEMKEFEGRFEYKSKGPSSAGS